MHARICFLVVSLYHRRFKFMVHFVFCCREKVNSTLKQQRVCLKCCNCCIAWWVLPGSIQGNWLYLLFIWRQHYCPFDVLVHSYFKFCIFIFNHLCHLRSSAMHWEMHVKFRALVPSPTSDNLKMATAAAVAVNSESHHRLVNENFKLK